MFLFQGVDNQPSNPPFTNGLRMPSGRCATGSRDVEIELHRDEFAEPMVVETVLDHTRCETFDLVYAIEVAAFGGQLLRLRLGDVLTMRGVVNCHRLPLELVSPWHSRHGMQTTCHRPPDRSVDIHTREP
jgi:hypothetical protein